MELAGLQDRAYFPGKSLGRFWREDLVKAEPDPVAYSEVDISWDILKVPSVWGKYRSLVSAEHHYIMTPDGREELYEVGADPFETLNLAETQAGRQAIARLRGLLSQV